jgi:hypothetical protein
MLISFCQNDHRRLRSGRWCYLIKTSNIPKRLRPLGGQRPHLLDHIELPVHCEVRNRLDPIFGPVDSFLKSRHVTQKPRRSGIAAILLLLNDHYSPAQPLSPCKGPYRHWLKHWRRFSCEVCEVETVHSGWVFGVEYVVRFVVSVDKSFALKKTCNRSRGPREPDITEPEV